MATNNSTELISHHQQTPLILPIHPHINGCEEVHLRPQNHFMSTLPKHFPTTSSRSNGPSAFLNQAYQFTTNTLPKPPLKGILKNTTSMSQHSIEPDVVPFDTVPPCDDCMERARLEGTYSGECSSQNCAMGTMRRGTSTHSLTSQGRGRMGNNLKMSSVDGFASTSFLGSQESLIQKTDPEVIENVESSV